MSDSRILRFLVFGLGLQLGCYGYDLPHLVTDTDTEGSFETVATDSEDTDSWNDTSDTNTSDTNTSDTNTFDTETSDTDTVDTDTGDTDTGSDTSDTDTVDTDTGSDTSDTDTVDTDTGDTDTGSETSDTDTVDTDTGDTDTGSDTSDTDTGDTDTSDTDTETDTAVPLLEMEHPLLAAGSDHTCAVTAAGAAKCWGWNWRGQVGDGNGGSSGDWAEEATPVTGLETNIAAVSAGGNHACAITIAAALECWGYNTDGQLGDGTKSESNGGIETTPVPLSNLSSGVAAVSVGGTHSCALSDAGGVMCWGDNFEGQVGDGLGGSGAADVLVPTDVLDLSSGVAAISSGTSFSCALMAADGRVMCWGEDDSGQLGCGVTYTGATQQLRPVFVVNLSEVRSISAGGSHTCAVLNPDGALKCWGWNEYGQLGDGTTDETNQPPATNVFDSGVVMVSAGDHHTCAVLETGAIQCWGRNHKGQLGNASASPGLWDPQPTPSSVVDIANAVAVTVGLKHSCALQSTGAIQCWGDDSRGQVGNGPLVNPDEAFLSPSDVVGIP